MEYQELEKEWLSKYDIKTGRLKENLSNECYEWSKNNHERTEELVNIQTKTKIADCYHKIIEVLKEYIDTTEDNYKIISIWIIATYFHEEFNTFPYLFFNAMRGSGKTRALKLISTLGAKGDGSVQNNLTEAVLFRIPRGTTTCIDEVEQIGRKEKQSLRELLNSAYKKGMKVKRMRKKKTINGEEQVVETFEPYFPIAMANIWGMDEVLGDRSISLVLEKSSNQAITKVIEDFDTNPIIQEIKRTLEQFNDVYAITLRKKTYITAWNTYIKEKYNIITSLTSLISLTSITSSIKLEEIESDELFNKIDSLGIAGRNLELFLPLMLIAEEIKVLDEFLKVCANFVTRKKDDEYMESKDVSLYEFINSINHEGMNLLFIKDLTRRFREMIGEADEEDRWLNEKWMGRALKRLNLITYSKKVTQGRQVILNYAKANEKLKMFKVEDKHET